MKWSPRLEHLVTSPIAEAYGWVEDLPGSASDCIDVSQAVPGHPPPPELRAALATAVGRSASARYTESLGRPELRDRYSRTLCELHNAGVRREQVAITSGCNQAFCLAIDALCNPGDRVVLPVPFYFNHDMWLRARHLEPVYLLSSGDGSPDLQAIDDAIDSRTRAVVMVSPNNPTGSTCSPADLRRCFEIARKHGVALLLDETYREFRDTSAPPHDLFVDPDWDQTLVHLYSFSKVFSIPGHRVGAIAAHPRLLEQMAKWIDCVTICPTFLGQEAALFGLENLGPWVESTRRNFAMRLERFRMLLEDGNNPWTVASAGAFFAWLQHPFVELDSRDVAQRLAREQGVLALAGSMFGPGQEAFLRLSFANLPEERLGELTSRLAQAAAAIV